MHETPPLPSVKIGTRGSPLALWQAEWISSRLRERWPGLEVSLVIIKTTGDKILHVPLAQVGGKGLFVKEIEEALLEGTVDLAVHSMKDVPTTFPDGLGLVCTTRREDPRDALVSRGIPFAQLPRGARIGTSALRRQAQLLALRPDLEMVVIRGNVETRLAKLDSEGLDGVVLAAAGLKRLGFAQRVTQYLPVSLSLPAIGQGALGLECRLDDGPVHRLVAFLDDPETAWAVAAERAFLCRCEGGCQVPLAAHGQVSGRQVQLDALIAAVDGQRVVRGTLTGAVEECRSLGAALADQLLTAGGREILSRVYDLDDSR